MFLVQTAVAQFAAGREMTAAAFPHRFSLRAELFRRRGGA